MYKIYNGEIVDLINNIMQKEEFNNKVNQHKKNEKLSKKLELNNTTLQSFSGSTYKVTSNIEENFYDETTYKVSRTYGVYYADQGTSGEFYVLLKKD